MENATLAQICENPDVKEVKSIRVSAKFLVFHWQSAAIITLLAFLGIMGLKHLAVPIPDAFAQGALGASIFSFFWFFSHKHCLFDIEQGAFVCYRNFVLFKHVGTLALFDDVLGISVEGEEQGGRADTWWVYRLVLVTKDGKKFNLADKTPFLEVDTERNSIDFTNKNNEAKILANVLGFNLVAGQEQRKIAVKPNDLGEPSIVFEEKLTQTGRILLYVTIAAIAIGVILVLIQQGVLG